MIWEASCPISETNGGELWPCNWLRLSLSRERRGWSWTLKGPPGDVFVAWVSPDAFSNKSAKSFPQFDRGEASYWLFYGLNPAAALNPRPHLDRNGVNAQKSETHNSASDVFTVLCIYCGTVKFSRCCFQRFGSVKIEIHLNSPRFSPCCYSCLLWQPK